jgi:hypothetical protein
MFECQESVLKLYSRPSQMPNSKISQGGAYDVSEQQPDEKPPNFGRFLTLGRCAGGIHSLFDRCTGIVRPKLLRSI